MTRSYKANRITQPIQIQRPRPLRDPAISMMRFTCFRLVPAGADMIAIELHYTTTRMAAFMSVSDA